MKAAEVVEALRRIHVPNGREWAFFAEIRVGTGYRSMKELSAGGTNPEQRLDAWAINLFPSKGLLRRTYEIKVSRSDFLHEIKHPEKRKTGLTLSNEFYFVTPKGLVAPEEIPEECGLIYINPDAGGVYTMKQAPYREVPDLPMRFVLSLARRAAEYEQKWKDAITYDKSRNTY